MNTRLSRVKSLKIDRKSNLSINEDEELAFNDPPSKSMSPTNGKDNYVGQNSSRMNGEDKQLDIDDSDEEDPFALRE